MQKQKQKQQKQKQKQKQQKQKQKQKKQKQQKQKQKQNQKNPESHAGSVGFLHVLFFHLFFYFVFFIAKIPRFISKQKNQSCEKNLGQVHSGLFLCICLFFWVFCCPKPNCPKTRGKPKTNKKNNPVRRILGKSIQDCFFLFIWFFMLVGSKD